MPLVAWTRDPKKHIIVVLQNHQLTPTQEPPRFIRQATLDGVDTAGNLTRGLPGLPQFRSAIAHRLIDNKAPDFNLPTPDGQFVSLQDFRGRKVILVFLRHFA